jgi:hypothetical protein
MERNETKDEAKGLETKRKEVEVARTQIGRDLKGARRKGRMQGIRKIEQGSRN